MSQSNGADMSSTPVKVSSSFSVPSSYFLHRIVSLFFPSFSPAQDLKFFAGLFLLFLLPPRAEFSLPCHPPTGGSVVFPRYRLRSPTLPCFYYHLSFRSPTPRSPTAFYSYRCPAGLSLQIPLPATRRLLPAFVIARLLPFSMEPCELRFSCPDP